MKNLVLLLATLLVCPTGLKADQSIKQKIKEQKLKAQMKSLQDRLDKLEKKVESPTKKAPKSSGLKTQDYGDKKIGSSGKKPASLATEKAPSASPSQIKQMYEALEQYKKNKAEADKYLQELMEEE